MIRQMKLNEHQSKSCKDASGAIMACCHWEDSPPPPPDWESLYWRLRDMHTTHTNDGKPLNQKQRPAKMPEDYGRQVLVRDGDNQEWTGARLGGYAPGSSDPWMDMDGSVWKRCEIIEEVMRIVNGNLRAIAEMALESVEGDGDGFIHEYVLGTDEQA